jgi:secondary thiamine-phosphate synthase enzyme
MKSKTEYLEFNTEEKIQFIRITEKVETVIEKSGVKEGLVLVNPMHITSAVIVNDDEEGIKKDYLDVLERLVPYNAEYRHNVGEDNAAAHIWRQLMAHQVVMPITDGKLDLGTWEQIFYVEFDGQRRKRVLVKVIGD